MRLFIAGLALALTAVGAQAQVNPQASQFSNAARIGQAASQKYQDNSQKVKANDKAYDAALRNLPDRQYDPWRGMR